MGLAGCFVVEMGVRTQIRAISGWTPFEIDRSNEIALHEGFEAVVDGRERDTGEFGLYAGKDLIGGGVVALSEQNVINQFTLRSGAQTAVREFLREPGGVEGVVGVGRHFFEEGTTNWNDSKAQV